MAVVALIADWMDGGLDRFIAEGLAELGRYLAKHAEFQRRYPEDA